MPNRKSLQSRVEERFYTPKDDGPLALIDVSPTEAQPRVLLSLLPEQLAALGFDCVPVAGINLHIRANATVVRVTSEDPDADGDVDRVLLELDLREIGLGEQREDSRRKAAKVVVPEKLQKHGERDVGGNSSVGEFGPLNRRIGA